MKIKNLLKVVALPILLFPNVLDSPMDKKVCEIQSISSITDSQRSLNNRLHTIVWKIEEWKSFKHLEFTSECADNLAWSLYSNYHESKWYFLKLLKLKKEDTITILEKDWFKTDGNIYTKRIWNTIISVRFNHNDELEYYTQLIDNDWKTSKIFDFRSEFRSSDELNKDLKQCWDSSYCQKKSQKRIDLSQNWVCEFGLYFAKQYRNILELTDNWCTWIIDAIAYDESLWMHHIYSWAFNGGNWRISYSDWHYGGNASYMFERNWDNWTKVD